MIRFTAHRPTGELIVGIGITKQHFAKLLRGEVSQIDLAPLGISNAKLFLIGGETELTMTRDFSHLFGTHTGVHVDPALIPRK